MKEESHNKMREDAKAVGENKINQKEFDKEIVELKEQLNIMMMPLKESGKGYINGWKMKKNVKWPIK